MNRRSLLRPVYILKYEPLTDKNAITFETKVIATCINMNLSN